MPKSLLSRELLLPESATKEVLLHAKKPHYQVYGLLQSNKELAVTSLAGHLSRPEHSNTQGFYVTRLDLLHLKYQHKEGVEAAEKRVYEKLGRADPLWKEAAFISKVLPENQPNSLIALQAFIKVVLGPRPRYFLATVISHQLDVLLYRGRLSEVYDSVLTSRSVPELVGTVTQPLLESGEDATIAVMRTILDTRVDTQNFVDNLVMLAAYEGTFFHRRLSHRAILASLMALPYKSEDEIIAKTHPDLLNQSINLEAPRSSKNLESTRTTQHFSAHFSNEAQTTEIRAKRATTKQEEGENPLKKIETDLSIVTRHSPSGLSFTLTIKLGVNSQFKDSALLRIDAPQKSSLQNHVASLDPETGLTDLYGKLNFIIPETLTTHMRQHGVLMHDVIADMMRYLDLTLAEIRATEESE